MLTETLRLAAIITAVRAIEIIRELPEVFFIV